MLHLSTRRFCSDSRDQLKNLTTRSANTKVGGRFGMKRCGPSCRHTRNASAVFKIFVLHPKKTFATISALFGHGAMSDLSPLSGVKRKLDFGAVRAAFEMDHILTTAAV